MRKRPTARRLRGVVNILVCESNMSQSKTQELLAFVRQLPVGMAYAPIYAKDQAIQSGKISKGKTPLERSHHTVMAPSDVALQIERKPAVFQAVGVFTGGRSMGLVILDVDRNLSRLKKKWGESLEGAPVITSTKANAAKYLFRVPEALWGSVKGFGLSDTGAGYEVLWGRQGVIYGAYPGSSDGKAPEGHYGFEGDLEVIPEAPEWLLAEMRDHAGKEIQDGGFIKNRKALDFSDRDPAEVAEIIQSALKVIPGQGSGSRDHWVKVGMAIHSELPTDLGLTLWSAWSAEDPEFSQEWSDRNPCEEVWKSFRKGPVSLGTLFWMADQQVPGRTWLSEDLRKIVEGAEATPLRYRQDYLGGEALIAKALKLEETIENPALLDQAKTILALEGGRREGATAIDRLIDAHLTYERNNGSKPIDVSQLDCSDFEYMIPGLLPKPWLLLVHGDGGTGKSAMCMTLCKHISQGIPFNVHGGMVDVAPGKCLWLNGDQSARTTRRAFHLIGVDKGVDVVPEWDMQWYRRFCKMQNANKYDLVIIDSLDGCNDSNPYEENRREYAMPLKRLARRNGVDFHPCTIIVIHHNNKNGSFRGTSAIRAAVDETWNMVRPQVKDLAELQLEFNSRVVTVEKSRDDREGQQMVFTLRSDYTYLINPMPELQTRLKADSPTEYMLSVLKVMREQRRPWSASELLETSEVGGDHRKRAIRYALQRLESQMLIERCAAPADLVVSGRPPTYYRATGTNAPVPFSQRSHARGESVECVSKDQTPSTGTDSIDKAFCQKSEFVKSPELEPQSLGTFDKGGLLTKPFVNENPSSASEVTFDTCFQVIGVEPRKAGLYTPEELEAIQAEAKQAWD
jgi:RecA-family ATPase